MSEYGPSGWYPQDDGEERFWDGRMWTEHRRTPPQQQEKKSSFRPWMRYASVGAAGLIFGSIIGAGGSSDAAGSAGLAALPQVTATATATTAGPTVTTTATTTPSPVPTVTVTAPAKVATVVPVPKPKPKPKPRVTSKPKVTTQPKPASVYYANCAAVRAAGADPIHRGDPGYARHLDRDGDGVGCE